MRRVITVEVDPADIYFRDIADQITEDGAEVEMLEELAEANERCAKVSTNEKEKQWCLSIAAVLREAVLKLRGLP